MIELTLFLLAYTSFFYPRLAAPLTLLCGVLWDLFWVLPLGLSSLIFGVYLLFLELYQKKYSPTNPLFLLFILAGACAVWTYAFIGYFRVWDIVVFVLAFIVLVSVIRKKHERQKHFV